MQRNRFSIAQKLIWLLVFVTVTGIDAASQQGVTAATVSVRVEDESRGPVGSAVVALTNKERNQTFEGKTDPQGWYRFTYLPLGSYDMTVERSGFATYQRKLTLTIGQTLDLPVTLSVAALTTSVDVTDA